jgi:hypothetical protein
MSRAALRSAPLPRQARAASAGSSETSAEAAPARPAPRSLPPPRAGTLVGLPEGRAARLEAKAAGCSVARVMRGAARPSEEGPASCSGAGRRSRASGTGDWKRTRRCRRGLGRARPARVRSRASVLSERRSSSSSVGLLVGPGRLDLRHAQQWAESERATGVPRNDDPRIVGTGKDVGRPTLHRLLAGATEELRPQTK